MQGEMEHATVRALEHAFTGAHIKRQLLMPLAIRG
jgi:hypothetical protein